MVGKWHQQHGLTNFRIREAHPAWGAWLLIDNEAACAHCLQLLIALTEHWRELLRRQSDKSKRRTQNCFSAKCNDVADVSCLKLTPQPALAAPLFETARLKSTKVRQVFR